MSCVYGADHSVIALHHEAAAVLLPYVVAREEDTRRGWGGQCSGHGLCGEGRDPGRDNVRWVNSARLTNIEPNRL